MNKNLPGFRTDSLPEQESFAPFLGLDVINNRLRNIEKKVGLRGNEIPVVTGSTVGDKIDSLIAALAVLGLIKDETP